MNTPRLIQFVFMTLFLVSNVQLDSQTPALSEPIASYNMQIELDVADKKLMGQTTLTWKNTASDTIYTLFFHLYYNAFKNSESTFFKERGVPEILSKNIDNDCGWGWSNIEEFEDAQGQSLVDKMRYVQPDDGNPNDQSVLQVDLITPILPGEEKVFNFKWTAKIPKTMPRTGYNKEFYFFAQWFPKIGVYEPAGRRYATKGQWNCHQYHSNGEYYADFGHYNVYLSVPSDYIVAASGELMGQEKEGEMKTWHFTAHDVIDFTWSCSPHFEVQKDSFEHTTIQYYSYPYKQHLKDRYFETLKFSMDYLQEHLGPYPYKTLSLVDPPIHGIFTGGMEYPTLITSLSFEFFPEGIRTPETLAVHEYIHQYFMQMVATHEVEDPWMDEGITTYYEGRIMDAYLGEDKSTIEFGGIKAGNKSYNRAEFFASPYKQVASNAIKSWEYTNGGYGDIVYNKAALWLQTLEGIIGKQHMDKIMSLYFKRWQFKHPCRHDFEDLVNSYVVEHLANRFPDGMSWFFDQVMYGTDLCDYKVHSIQHDTPNAPRGFFEDLENCEPSSDTEPLVKSIIEVHRTEGIYVPLEIEIIFESGRDSLVTWFDDSMAKTITVVDSEKVTHVQLDPKRKIYLDKNWINNNYCTGGCASAKREFIAYCIDRCHQLFQSLTLFL